MVKRVQVQTTIIICGSHKEAGYLFDQHQRLNDNNIWMYSRQPRSAQHPDGRVIQWLDIEAMVDRMRGLRAVVVLTEDAGRSVYYNKRLARVAQHADQMNARYVHV